MTNWRWDSNLEYWLRLAHQRYNQEVNQVLAKHGPLTERYWPVLQTLLVEQGIQQISICERTGEPGYQTSRVLDKLERLGFVDRRSDPMNHRARLVYLTEKGEALRLPLTEAMQALQQRWLQDIQPAFKRAADDDQTVSADATYLEELKTLFTAWLQRQYDDHSDSLSVSGSQRIPGSQRADVAQPPFYIPSEDKPSANTRFKQTESEDA